jgi:hypothetical protein
MSREQSFTSEVWRTQQVALPNANVGWESPKYASYLLPTSQYMHSILRVGGVPMSYIEAEWRPDGDTLDSRDHLEKRNGEEKKSVQDLTYREVTLALGCWKSHCERWFETTYK